MLKSFSVLLLIVAVIADIACHHPILTPNCAFDSWEYCPPGAWQCNCSVSASYEYDATSILNNLLQYKPFADFYDREIKPLRYTIRYFYNPDLPPNTARTVVDTPTHRAKVELGNISPNQDLAFIVAHELRSIPLQESGFLPSLKPQKPSCEDLSVDMYDMLSTPIRDSALTKYGFDVQREFYAFRASVLFSAPCGDANDIVGQLKNACLYVQLVLYWQFVLGNQGTPPVIDAYFHDCLPISWSIGHEIEGVMAQLSNTSVQERATMLFNEIINNPKYEITDCIAAP
jgi:hypothetical protein